MSYKLRNLFKILLIFSALIVLINSTFSEKRLCGDQKCSIIISTGKTNIRYHSPEKHILSFNGNNAVRIFGKSLVSNLWEVEITGRRGYVPSNFIVEEKVNVKKDKLIEVSAIEDIEIEKNLVASKTIDKIDLKSSQINKPDIDEISSTTTSPLITDEMKNQINTDKIDTNISTELPSSSPVQKNINFVDGTPLKVEDIYSNEGHNDGSAENVHINDDNYFLNNEKDQKLNDKKHKFPNSKTIIPSKSTEFLNVATKTTLNSNTEEGLVNENTYKNINSDNLNQDQKTEDQFIPLTIEKQDSIDIKTDLLDSANKTDKSAVNINDNSEKNLNMTEITPENTVEVNEIIPPPNKYYTLGDKKIEKKENYITQNIEKVKSVESVGSEKFKSDDISNIPNSIEMIENEYPKAALLVSNTKELESKENDEMTIKLEDNNNATENIYPKADATVSNKNEIESNQNDIITNKLEENNDNKNGPESNQNDNKLEENNDSENKIPKAELLISNKNEPESKHNDVITNKLEENNNESENKFSKPEALLSNKNEPESTQDDVITNKLEENNNLIENKVTKPEALVSNKNEPESKQNDIITINLEENNNGTENKFLKADTLGTNKNELESKQKDIITNKLEENNNDSENKIPKAEALLSNKNERESMPNDVITNKLEENKNESENIFSKPEALLSNKNEPESTQNDIISNGLRENDNGKSFNYVISQTIKSKDEEKLVDKEKSESENIKLAENTVKYIQTNDKQSISYSLPSEEPSDNIQIVEERPLKAVSDLQENINQNYLMDNDHGHHLHSNSLPPIFTTQPNQNYDLKPEENIKAHSEITAPSYDDSPFSDPNIDITTKNPIQDSVTENILENKNKEEITTALPLLPQIHNTDEFDVNTINPEDRISENKNEYGEEQLSLPNENEGLFAIILNTVNNFLSSSSAQLNKKNDEVDNELEKILYPGKEVPPSIDNKIEKFDNTNHIAEEGFCENIGPNSCPTTDKLMKSGVGHKNSFHCTSELDFFTSMSDKILEMFDVLVCLAIAAASSILFAFGYYCICNCRKESSLISKLNIVERSLLASYKEVAIVKNDLLETRNKLSSIQDNSFGSNDMVIALKKDILEHEETNMKLQEQITNLEKELENAAEAGLELNKIVSDLLNSQNGDVSIANSVEELQKQLNEQQKTIEEINTILGEKSRENSELNIFLSEQGRNFQKAMQELQEKLDESENNKILLQSKFDEAQKEINENLLKNLNAKENTILSLKHELDLLQPKYNDLIKKCQASEARVEALEECIDSTKKDSKVNIKEFMDVANLKADILAIKRERDSIKERLEGEMDARKLLSDHVKIISEEVSALKLEYNQSEKEKLEAQTRLDVLSTYFREKETQLQKELSVKEAMWMKQQGETTSTVERVRTMQDEIQALKSQNDSLRAEIEAQSAAHKAQISSLENRAHETWLTSRQSERKFDEARSEAAALRRKLTALAGVPSLQTSVADELTPNSLNNAPSPIHMDAPNSPQILGGLPPPPPFLPPPFMAPPPLPPHPHFLGMPPPFLPPREMRPPPLGRLMSPPPIQPASNQNRYSPSVLDDEDDDDYEYEHRHTRGSRGGGRYTPENGRRYSPDNGRNYSPDSRYNYTTDIMSTYDTETDFSPPPSPRGFRSSGGGSNRYDDRSTPVDSRGERNSRIGNNGNGVYKAFSPPPQQIKSQQISNSDIRNKSKSNKGLLSSGSEKSFDSRKSKGKMKV